ncbi:hypothetical protein GCM10011608_61430 [Micromonospora sonchi]|uniref:Uncharacterized protein n=1 Tax=Micromonospora sonchi TaxID=1763543 RepID=A0A917X410_9ACTN|nr:hypothetical protein GCM10011608_61430 [Micromonospora sonchi]
MVIDDQQVRLIPVTSNATAKKPGGGDIAVHVDCDWRESTASAQPHRAVRHPRSDQTQALGQGVVRHPPNLPPTAPTEVASSNLGHFLPPKGSQSNNTLIPELPVADVVCER